ncbi:HNH endonuclease [Vibrio vulnificus]|uniref:HNH endonuclease n=2 Tax=Vibrio vulnificus TaxID=672 RepID=UPI001CC90412|nr:HNH endonuclease [Vibrio vulnificus]MCA0776832.1 HNH endonuclease [Vibrio vulnificus]HDY7553983.1 HNH endonuclease [Vibrio vulnificus]
MKEVTGFDAGLSGQKQIELALAAIKANGGVASMTQIYEVVEEHINPNGFTLSFQGKSSLRNFVNKAAVKAGLIQAYDKSNPGWRATSSGQSISLAAGNLANSNEDELLEGNELQTLINKYERCPKARRKCISHHGCICKVCGFNFEKEFGSVGKGFIHVHHVVPLSSIGHSYVVDPVEDLVPLCANCHAMAHISKEVLSIDTLIDLKKLAGV